MAKSLKAVPRDTIQTGDAIKLLRAWEPGSVDLVFADPPFNIGYVYDQYRDDVPDDKYVAWTRDWMAACRDILTPTGSFYIAIGDEFAADVRVLGRALGLSLRNWIIWHYTFGQNTKMKYARAHTHIFYFTRDAKKFTFNDKAVRFPSARHTEYQDLRAAPAGRVPDDVWDDFPRVCGTFKERAGWHGCQMPEALLTRIVLASSRPGDTVLDPFVGSGTTVVAAKRNGRHYVGIDISPEYAKHTRTRLASVRDESAATPADGNWPALHRDTLAQLFRETKVTIENLIPNAVALRVIAAGLAERVGYTYPVAEIVAELQRMKATLVLPKLPNDTPFKSRKHVTTEGKRYKRTKMIVQPRRTRGKGTRRGDGEERQAV